MISVSLSVSRLSNVITPGVSVCGFSRCQSLSDGLNGIMLQICYLLHSNFPYYFVADVPSYPVINSACKLFSWS